MKKEGFYYVFVEYITNKYKVNELYIYNVLLICYYIYMEEIMSKISMMFNIISLLQTNYILSARQLSNILETTPRNIKAYIESLRNSGVPIRGLSGNTGGYFLCEKFELKNPRLNEMEYSALMLAEDVLTKENGFIYENEIKKGFAKIKAAQGEIMGDSDLIKQYEYVYTKGNMDISKELKKNLSIIRKAILNKKKIFFTHYNPVKDKPTKRTVSPYNLIYRDSSWYIIGLCHLRAMVRMFKLVRLTNLQVLEEKYYIPPDYSIKKFMNNTLNLNPGEEYIVEIKFFHPASVWVSEKLWLPTQKILQLKDRSIIFKAKVNGLTDIKNWILGFGKNAKVLKPPVLVREITGELKKMCSNYDI